MAYSASNWPRPDEAPSIDDLSKCVHCGLCVNACPTYVVTGLEVESPRGRIHLARSVGEGRIALTPTVQFHWELCLQCRACEAVCPSGVPYGRIMEGVRTQLDAGAPQERSQRRVRKLLLRQVLARPSVLGAALAPVRAFSGWRYREMVLRLGLFRLAGSLRNAERQLPAHVGSPFRPGDSLAQPLVVRSTAILFTGCVMGELFGDVHRATGRVLARHGIAADAVRGQGCCGALHAHDGDIDFARKLARRNIDALRGDAPIVVNSAGCGAAMKEYGELLANDPAYAVKAKEFGARVRDLTEYLTGIGTPPRGIFPARVTYQDPCHLAHAQRIREQPRALLRSLEGCELVESSGADVCCGAAGIYSVVQPAMSATLRSRKAEQFRRDAPEVVATANPGCQMQYEAAVREADIPARVMHIAEILDEAYRAGEN